jgi:hypothetical protein
MAAAAAAAPAAAALDLVGGFYAADQVGDDDDDLKHYGISARMKLHIRTKLAHKISTRASKCSGLAQKKLPSDEEIAADTLEKLRHALKMFKDEPKTRVLDANHTLSVEDHFIVMCELIEYRGHLYAQMERQPRHDNWQVLAAREMHSKFNTISLENWMKKCRQIGRKLEHGESVKAYNAKKKGRPLAKRDREEENVEPVLEAIDV